MTILSEEQYMEIIQRILTVMIVVVPTVTTAILTVFVVVTVNLL